MKKIIYAISSILISSIFSKDVSAENNNSKVPFHMLDKLVIRKDKNDSDSNANTDKIVVKEQENASEALVVVLPGHHDNQLAKENTKTNGKNIEKSKVAENTVENTKNKTKEDKKTVEIPLELPKDPKKNSWPQKNV